MGLICLREAVSFHPDDDGEAILLRTTDGVTLSLNQSATLLLQAALSSNSQEHALASLETCIDASVEVVEQALYEMLASLKEQGWIEDARHLTSSVNAVATTPVSSSWQQSHEMEREPENLQEGPTSIADPGAPLGEWDGSWEIFLDGRLYRAPLPPFTWHERVSAGFSTAAMLLSVGSLRLLARLFTPFPGAAQLLRAWEWRCLVKSLMPLHQTRAIRRQPLSPAIQVRLARRELVISRLLAHLLPPALCLERSASCCRYLRTLGLPAQVVIGHSRLGKVDQFAFHAWVELAGLVVNDGEELQTGYHVLQRLPPSVEGTHRTSVPRGKRLALIGGVGALALALSVYALRRRNS